MVSSTTYVVTGIILILIGVSVGWFLFPHLIQRKISDAKSLKKGNGNRQSWTKAPFAVDFNVFIWNVTNVDKIYEGARPVVQEIGPFVYNEWEEKANVSDNATEDTVTFQMLNTFYFDTYRTLPLTGEEKIVIPHMFLLALVQIFLVQKPSSLAMLNKGIPHLFSNPTSAFLTTTPREFLFDGITINCTKVEEFEPNALCDEIMNNPKGLNVGEEGILKFSIFGLVNATLDENLITVRRGTTDVKEVGQVVLYNGKPKQVVWDEDECNKIKATDTTIFAPIIDNEQSPDLRSFGTELCRSLPFKGMFTTDLGDMSNDLHLKCFCQSNSTCLKKEAFEITKCKGVPVIMTLPHCMECHPDYLNSITGYNPVWNDTVVKSITRNSTTGYRRLQYNMWIFEIGSIDVLRGLPEQHKLMPIFWLEEGFVLSDTLATTLLYGPFQMVNLGRYILLIVGIMCICYAVIIMYTKSKRSPEENSTKENRPRVTRVSPAY